MAGSDACMAQWDPRDARELSGTIAIDTGAVYVNVRGLGILTAVRLPEREFVQVPYQE